MVSCKIVLPVCASIITLMMACTSADFLGGAKSKNASDAKAKKPDCTTVTSKTADCPNGPTKPGVPDAGDGDDDDDPKKPGGDDSNADDDKKPGEEGDRVKVNCTDKTATECKKLVKAKLGDEGDEIPKIKVVGCKDDDKTTCSQIDELGDTAPQVILSEGGDETDDDDDDTDDVQTDDGEFKVKDIALGVGGPGKPAYFFRAKDRAKALECARQTQKPSSFNSAAADCKTSVRIGDVKFTGSIKDTEKAADETLPEKCVCRTSDSPPVAGLVWGDSFVPPDQFTP